MGNGGVGKGGDGRGRRQRGGDEHNDHVSLRKLLGIKKNNQPTMEDKGRGSGPKVGAIFFFWWET